MLPINTQRNARRAMLLAGVSAVALAGVAASLGLGFQPASGARQDAPPSTPGANPAADLARMGESLVAGLNETEGCLGVDVGNFQTGKTTIVAWFENKAAVERWYHHPAHVRMLGAFGARPEDRAPLEHVTDPDLPVMVMASISFNGPPAIPQSPVPFSQISIEMYTPLPGGASINGRLAPKAFPVAHHRSLDAAD